MLNIAEGIYYQIAEAEHLTDDIRLIVGLPLLGTQTSYSSHEQSPFEDSSEMNTTVQPYCSVDEVRLSPDEGAYERSLSGNFL